MEILYKSTRGGEENIKASEAILKGLATDGGLFVPNMLPKLDVSFDSLKDSTYQDVAYEVMKLFFSDFTEEELKECINKAYDEKFDTSIIAPLVEADGAYYLELFHGSTIAFKDMALSILPHLMITSAKKQHVENEIVILTATSGDTGKAALAGFSNVKGTKIIVFYPKDGVSQIQEKQMLTQKGDNTHVVAVYGNFDDAQTGVKKIFSNVKLKQLLEQSGYQFSSANSINIGRLVPQIVYYVYAYVALLREKKVKDCGSINVVVPTGNFGNILAAYYAKELGVPIRKLLCASNENKVLFDFLQSGTYNKKREFILTTSPSMDILVSSNLERLIYKIAGNRADLCAKLMEELSVNGSYTISESMMEELNDFYGGYASEKETANCINDLYSKTGYVIDTHTAVASAVYKKYKKDTKDQTPSIIVSTASPFKFTGSVMEALGETNEMIDDFEKVEKLSKIANVKIPEAIEDIRKAEILHHTICEVENMEQEIIKFLDI